MATLAEGTMTARQRALLESVRSAQEKVDAAKIELRKTAARPQKPVPQKTVRKK